MEMQHSDMLFFDENCQPLRFYAVPSDDKARVRPLIEHGGGTITSKLDGSCIKLAVKGRKIKGEGYISVDFVFDSVKENRLLDMNKYRVKPGEEDEMSDSSFGDMEPTSYVIKASARDIQGRKKYSLEDDMKIIKFILDNNWHSQVGGNDVWKTMEAAKVCGNHSWQSMKDRYRRTVLPRIKSYPLNGTQIARLTGNVYDAKADAKAKEKLRRSAEKLKSFLGSTRSSDLEIEEVSDDSEVRESRRIKVKHKQGHKVQGHTQGHSESPLVVNETSDEDRTTDEENIAEDDLDKLLLSKAINRENGAKRKRRTRNMDRNVGRNMNKNNPTCNGTMDSSDEEHLVADKDQNGGNFHRNRSTENVKNNNKSNEDIVVEEVSVVGGRTTRASRQTVLDFVGVKKRSGNQVAPKTPTKSPQNTRLVVITKKKVPSNHGDGPSNEREIRVQNRTPVKELGNVQTNPPAKSTPSKNHSKTPCKEQNADTRIKEAYVSLRRTPLKDMFSFRTSTPVSKSPAKGAACEMGDITPVKGANTAHNENEKIYSKSTHTENMEASDNRTTEKNRYNDETTTNGKQNDKHKTHSKSAEKRTKDTDDVSVTSDRTNDDDDYRSCDSSPAIQGTKGPGTCRSDNSPADAHVQPGADPEPRGAKRKLMSRSPELLEVQPKKHTPEVFPGPEALEVNRKCGRYQGRRRSSSESSLTRVQHSKRQKTDHRREPRDGEEEEMSHEESHEEEEESQSLLIDPVTTRGPEESRPRLRHRSANSATEQGGALQRETDLNEGHNTVDKRTESADFTIVQCVADVHVSFDDDRNSEKAPEENTKESGQPNNITAQGEEKIVSCKDSETSRNIDKARTSSNEEGVKSKEETYSGQIDGTICSKRNTQPQNARDTTISKYFRPAAAAATVVDDSSSAEGEERAESDEQESRSKSSRPKSRQDVLKNFITMDMSCPESLYTQGTQEDDDDVIDPAQFKRMCDVIKASCETFGLSSEEYMSILYAHSGSVKQATHWILNGDSEGCVAWTAEDDDVILHGKRTAMLELKTRRDSEDVANRRTFLLSHLRD